MLGVQISPEANVGALRSLAEAAAAAGYQELALLARGAAFPWPWREYRLAIGKVPRDRVPLVVRESDTIQMLVQALDVYRTRNAEPPPLSGPAAARPR